MPGDQMPQGRHPGTRARDDARAHACAAAAAAAAGAVRSRGRPRRLCAGRPPMGELLLLKRSAAANVRLWAGCWWCCCCGCGDGLQLAPRHRDNARAAPHCVRKRCCSPPPARERRPRASREKPRLPWQSVACLSTRKQTGAHLCYRRSPARRHQTGPCERAATGPWRGRAHRAHARRWQQGHVAWAARCCRCRPFCPWSP